MVTRLLVVVDLGEDAGGHEADEDLGGEARGGEDDGGAGNDYAFGEVGLREESDGEDTTNPGDDLGHSRRVLAGSKELECVDDLADEGCE